MGNKCELRMPSFMTALLSSRNMAFIWMSKTETSIDYFRLFLNSQLLNFMVMEVNRSRRQK